VFSPTLLNLYANIPRYTNLLQCPYVSAPHKLEEMTECYEIW